MTRKQAIKGLLKLAVGVAIGFALFAVVIVTDGLRDEIRHTDVGLVLGNTVQTNGQPSPRLRARLDKTLELYRAGLFAEVIVSGGVGVEGFDEAEVMKQYLIANGVPEARIHADSQGLDTHSTARNAAAMMAAHGWSSTLVVSQYYHVPRCRLALTRSGVVSVASAHADYFEVRDIYSTAREVIAYGFYTIRQSD